MVGTEALHDELQAEVPAMLGEIERLAAIDSGSYDAAGVDLVADAIGELLAARGFAIERAPLDGRGSRMTATMALGPGPKLLVVGHADTVWPAGTAADWPAARDGAMLSGPGVGDMKGCVVMAAHAIGAALRHGVDGIGAIEVLIVPDEELGSPGSRPWIEERARGAGACLGLEAGWPGGGVVVARGAVGALYVSARGQTAHAAAHEGEGASAVSALAPLVAELEALARPDDGVRVSVGVFRGGTARQVVPDAAELHVDLRAPDAAAADALMGRIRAVVAARRPRGGPVEPDGRAAHPPAASPDGAEVELSGGHPAPYPDAVQVELRGGFTRPAFPVAASRELWALASARAAELGLPLHEVHARGGSDASFAAALGVPTLDGLGPICHDSCARGERIEIDSLADRGALMAGLVLDLAARWRIAAPA